MLDDTKTPTVHVAFALLSRPFTFTSANRPPSHSFVSHCFPRRISAKRICQQPSRLMMTQLVDWHDSIHHIISLISTRGDIGPLTNVDLETAGLFGAVSGGTLLASLIILFILRV